MTYKGSWARGKSSSYCTRDCMNRDKKCDECYKFDFYKPKDDYGCVGGSEGIE